MVDILTKLEKMRDNLTKKTPTTSARRTKTSAGTQPKIEIIRVESAQPLSPPTNSPGSRVHPTDNVKTPSKERQPTNSPCNQMHPTNDGKRLSEARKPRRSAPKIPEEGSLKQRSTDAPMLISARPLEENMRGVKLQHIEDETQAKRGAGMLKSNPLLEEIKKQEKREKRKRENRESVEEEDGRESVLAGVESEHDPKKGVLLVNPSFREETKMEGGGREGGASRRGIEREEKGEVERRGEEREELEEEEEEEEEWKDDFILEPPENFSQPSVEVQDATGLLPPPDLVPSLPPNLTPPLSSNVPPFTHSLTPVGEKYYTSLDDYSIGSQDSMIFDAAEEEDEEEEEEEEEEADGLYDREMSPPVSYHQSGHGLQSGRDLMWDERATRINGGGALNGVKEQEELLASFPSEVKARSLAHAHNTGVFRRDEEEEQDFDDEDDLMYRRPTSRIPGMRHVPSWGHSDRSGTPEGQDDLPPVVYEDDVAALIW